MNNFPTAYVFCGTATVVFLTGLVVARADTPMPEPVSRDVLAYIGQPAHVAAISAAATKAFADFWSCGLSRAGADVRVATFKNLSPVIFDANGALTSGIIAERVTVSGCGATHLQNVLTVARKGQARIVPSVPGTTIADPLLIHDTLPIAYGATVRRVGSCRQVKFVDSAFGDFEGTQNAAAKFQDNQGRPWRETWTLNACGNVLSMTIHYVPDATGTAISAGPG